jgi:hypothetical protein
VIEVEEKGNRKGREILNSNNGSFVGGWHLPQNDSMSHSAAIKPKNGFISAFFSRLKRVRGVHIGCTLQWVSSNHCLGSNLLHASW